MTPESILTALWQGATLWVYWDNWPSPQIHPQWQGVLARPHGPEDVTDQVLLQRLIDRDLITRPHKQHVGDRLEWKISNAGLRLIGKPTLEEMRAVRVKGGGK